MKIITSNAVYVQKDDIEYLNSLDLSLPSSIMNKIIEYNIMQIDDKTRYEFIKFEEQSDIEFFKSLGWIIDYNEVKDLSESEMISLYKKIIEEKNAIARKYNLMSESNRINNMDYVRKYKLLDFKLYSLLYIINLKKEHIQTFILDDNKNKKSKGIKKLIRKLFQIEGDNYGRNKIK